MQKQIKKCFFCSNLADTKEHIIPQWLQKHFKLSNQKLSLWNNTALLYKQALIPLCKICNGGVLSRLEQKIQLNIATETDYYLWALKIRYLLSFKDTTLQFDRADPSKGKLLSNDLALVGQEIVKHAFTNYENPSFIYRPNPFGTVLIFDNPLEDGKFGFTDVPHPFSGLTISLSANKILSVLFTDRGLVKKELIKHYKNKGGIKKFCRDLPAKSTNILVRLLMLKLLIKQYQIKNIPNSVSLTENGVICKQLPNKVKYRNQLKRDVLVGMCQILKLDEKYGHEFYNSLPIHYKG